MFSLSISTNKSDLLDDEITGSHAFFVRFQKSPQLPAWPMRSDASCAMADVAKVTSWLSGVIDNYYDQYSYSILMM